MGGVSVELFSSMLSLQLVLFCLIALGLALKKIGMIEEKGRKTLSDLLINVILPCNILHAYMGGVQADGELLKNCLLMVLFSAVLQVIATVGGRILFARYPAGQQSVLRYGLICSNSSFVGIPIAEVLFGDLGVMYTSVFQIPLRFTMWTAGLSLFTSVSRKDAFRKLVRHPCIIAVVLGVVLLVLPVPLPGFLEDTITTVSRCTTPISMLVIGVILADAPVRSLFSPTVLWFSALRLLLFPLLVYVLMLPLPGDPLIRAICVLMTGMPIGSTTSILADKYGGDAPFSSQLAFTSTLLSIATIPLLTLLV